MTIDRDNWLAWRRQGVGASDIAGILGISPWASPYSVWADKVGLVPDGDPTEAMQLGLALEPAIGTLFHERTGLYLCGAQTLVEHPALSWARATLDGWCGESPDTPQDAALGSIQSKATADPPKKWEEQIPDQYAAQVQWEMFVTGYERAWVPVIHASWGLAFRVYEVERDQADIDYIVAAVTAFWNEHVETGIAPEADGSDATTYALRHLPVDPEAVCDLPDDIAELVAMRARFQAAEKDATATLEQIENRIRAALGECTEGHIGGELAVSWRPQSRRGFDAKQLRADRADIAALYETTSTNRVLRFHNKEK